MYLPISFGTMYLPISYVILTYHQDIIPPRYYHQDITIIQDYLDFKETLSINIAALSEWH